MKPKSIPVIVAAVFVVCTVGAPQAAEHCVNHNDCTSPEDRCIGGACVPPVPDPDAYVADAMTRWSSYVWAIQFPATFEPDAERCCFDYTGNGLADDGFGALMGLLGSIPGAPDPIAFVNTALANGDLVKVFDWRELAPDLAVGDVQLSVFESEWTDGTIHADRILGMGHTTFRRTSFGPYGATDQLNDGDVDFGLVTVTGNQFTLGLPLLLVGSEDLITVRILEPRLEAPVSDSQGTCTGLCTVDEDRGPTHVPQIVGGAKFGGIILADEMLTHMDTYYRHCSCAGVDPHEPVIVWEPDYNTSTLEVSCTDNIGNPANCNPDDPCSELNTVCAVLGIFGNILDVDMDNDTVNESLTLGLRLGLAGTTLDPMSDELFSDGFESGGTSAWSGSS